ncbi:unnamed protein product [Blepharisma stoltei]|uniref:Protein kinase domain-containing protein n=1 Tax=Blepharisma stoltei TaxID=1481888 RepID=A0AAU9J6D7_9CILI|nr:unnamed protein product [Blepharisma stoltei]
MAMTLLSITFAACKPRITSVIFSITLSQIFNICRIIKMKPSNSLTAKRQKYVREANLPIDPDWLDNHSDMSASTSNLDFYNAESYKTNSESSRIEDSDLLNFLKLKIREKLQKLQDNRNLIKNSLRIKKSQFQSINFQNWFKPKKDQMYSDLFYCKLADEYYFLKAIYSDKKIFKVPLLVYCNSRLRHENIVKTCGYTKINNQKYIVLEYLPKTLYEYLDDTLDLKQRLGLILDIGRGLCFMHMKNTVLMNLSPWSVFISPEGKAVIFDLDCCSNLNMETQSEMTYKEQDFASPEALNGNRGFYCDVYSYGLMVYYILTQGPYSEYIGLDDIPEKFQDIVKVMLRNNPYERPDIDFCYKQFENLERELQNR